MSIQIEGVRRGSGRYDHAGGVRAMMQHQMDQLWAIERSRSVAEQRAADERAGIVAAGISRAVHGLSRRTRLVTVMRRFVSGHG